MLHPEPGKWMKDPLSHNSLYSSVFFKKDLPLLECTKYWKKQKTKKKTLYENWYKVYCKIIVNWTGGLESPESMNKAALDERWKNVWDEY